MTATALMAALWIGSLGCTVDEGSTPAIPVEELGKNPVLVFDHPSVTQGEIQLQGGSATSPAVARRDLMIGPDVNVSEILLSLVRETQQKGVVWQDLLCDSGQPVGVRGGSRHPDGVEQVSAYLSSGGDEIQLAVESTSKSGGLLKEGEFAGAGCPDELIAAFGTAASE